MLPRAAQALRTTMSSPAVATRIAKLSTDAKVRGLTVLTTFLFLSSPPFSSRSRPKQLPAITAWGNRMSTFRLRGGMDGEAKISGGDDVVVAVVAPSDSVALKTMPDIKGVTFLVGNDMKRFKEYNLLPKTQAVLFVPPGDPSVLSNLWTEVKGTAFWVHSFFAGVDGLAGFIKAHLMDSSVPLTNGRGAFSSSLAEYAMTTILHYNKQVPRIQDNTKNKIWDKFVMDVVKGKTIGLLGLGDINKHTARLARAFGMKIIALRRSPKKGTEGVVDKVYGYEDRLKLLAESDYVVSALPGTPETTNFCGEKEFSAMKKTAVFINIGRGVTVDEKALCTALNSEEIRGAALDVFWTEPLPKTSPLWDCKNVLITAHNADLTVDYAQLGWKVWEENLRAFQEERMPVTIVDKTAGY